MVDSNDVISATVFSGHKKGPRVGAIKSSEKKVLMPEKNKLAGTKHPLTNKNATTQTRQPNND